MGISRATRKQHHLKKYIALFIVDRAMVAAAVLVRNFRSAAWEIWRGSVSPNQGVHTSRNFALSEHSKFR